MVSGTPSEYIGSRTYAESEVRDALISRFNKDVRENNAFFDPMTVRIHDQTDKSFQASYGTMYYGSGKIYTEYWERSILPDKRYVWRRKSTIAAFPARERGRGLRVKLTIR